MTLFALFDTLRSRGCDREKIAYGRIEIRGYYRAPFRRRLRDRLRTASASAMTGGPNRFMTVSVDKRLGVRVPIDFARVLIFRSFGNRRGERARGSDDVRFLGIVRFEALCGRRFVLLLYLHVIVVDLCCDIDVSVIAAVGAVVAFAMRERSPQSLVRASNDRANRGGRFRSGHLRRSGRIDANLC